MRKLTTLLAVIAACGLFVQAAMASGTLADNGTMTMSFNDASGYTTISATNDGTYIWTAAGGSTSAVLAKYTQGGSLIQTYVPGVDFRALYVGAGGQLYAKEYCGRTYSISTNGVASLICAINDPDCQSKGGLSADYSTLYLRSGATVYQFNAANCTGGGSFNLTGMGGNELNYPEMNQLATAPGGRIFTFADGVVSEWPVGGGARIGQCTLALQTPGDFNTNFSFGVGVDGMVYVFDAGRNQWTVWDIGLQPVPVQEMTWGHVKSLYK